MFYVWYCWLYWDGAGRAHPAGGPLPSGVPGYDSAGLAVYDQEKGLQVVKAKGRLQVLYDLTDGGALVPGVMGVGHTRWATTARRTT